MDALGKMLVFAGLGLAALGALVWLLGSLSGGTGKLLPGDIFIQRGHVRFYFPVATCLVLSVVLSLVLWWLRK